MGTKAEKLVAKGRSFEARGNYQKALEAYREATKVDPIDPEAWTALGEAAVMCKVPEEAAEAFFKVCDMYARAGMPREALKLVKRVMELAPEHQGARRFKRMLESRPGMQEAVEPPPDAAEGTPPPVAPPVEAAPPARAASEGEPQTIELEAEIADDAEIEALKDEPSMRSTRQSVAPPLSPEPAPAPPPPAPAPVETRSAPRTSGPPPMTRPSGSIKRPPVPPARPSGERKRVSAPQEVVDPSAADAPSPLTAALAAVALTGGKLDGGVADEFSFGRVTAELALDDLSLKDRLPNRDQSGHSEIALDDEPKMDVVQAVAGAIGSSPLLSELDSDLVKRLIEAGSLVQRVAGETVFRQGDAGTSLFLILAGEVAVLREAAGEPPLELAKLRAGAFFGEMALITNQPRSATVRALQTCNLLEVSRKAVRGLIEREPRVLKLLMRFFRARLVGTLLQTSPVFEPFSREDRRKLVSAFRLRELGAGHAVFEEGSRAEGLFVLLAGRLEVVKGLEQVLGLLAPGDVFGEMSLLDNSMAMATVRAKTRSWVLLLPRGAFEELAERYPQIRGQLRALAETRRARNEASPPAGPRERRLEPL